VCVKTQISATVRQVLMKDRRQRNDDDINYVRRRHTTIRYDTMEDDDDLTCA